MMNKVTANETRTAGNQQIFRHGCLLPRRTAYPEDRRLLRMGLETLDLGRAERGRL